MSDEDESAPTAGFDALAREHDDPTLLDPDNTKVYFEREQADEEEYPGTYRDVGIRERADGTETLSVELTLRQLQGWADTLGAKLSEERRRVGEDMATVDELYLLYRTRDNIKMDAVGTAFTFRAAKAAQAELRYELDEPWCQEIVIETVPFFTE